MASLKTNVCSLQPLRRPLTLSVEHDHKMQPMGLTVSDVQQLRYRQIKQHSKNLEELLRLTAAYRRTSVSQVS